MSRTGKRFFLSLFMLSLFSLLISCGGKKEDPKSSPTPNPDEKTQPSSYNSPEMPGLVVISPTPNPGNSSGNFVENSASNAEKGQNANTNSEASLANSNSSPSPSSTPTAKPNIPKRSMEATSIASRGDTPWNIEANKVEFDENTKRARVTDLIWKLKNKDGGEVITVKGKAADINTQTQNVAFDGPVNAVSSKGEKLTVNHLVWDNTKRKLLGSRGVKIEREDSTLTGDNLVASPDLKVIKVEGNVHVVFPDANLSTNSDSGNWETDY